MEVKDYFEDYKQAKCSVLYLLNQLDDVNELEILEKLGYNKQIDLYDQIIELTNDVMDEEKEENRNYHKEYLELKLLSIRLVEKYYKDTIDLNERKKLDYDDSDIEDNKIKGYYHFFETAGESAWTTFGIEEPFIPNSKLVKLKEDTNKELKNLEESKTLGGNMSNYFKEYKQGKLAINYLVCQFYDHYLSPGQADEIGLVYTEDDLRNQNYVDCVSHGYTAEGLYLWEVLGLEDSVITHRNMWKNREEIIAEERQDIDYHYESLKLKAIVANMVGRYYSTTTDVKYMILSGLHFDEELDLDSETERIDVCSNYSETAGEVAFLLLGIETNTVAKSDFYQIERKIEKEMTELEMIKGKQKKLGGYYA